MLKMMTASNATSIPLQARRECFSNRGIGKSKHGMSKANRMLNGASVKRSRTRFHGTRTPASAAFWAWKMCWKCRL